MEQAKQVYGCPSLTVYGTVRNLTGGSAGTAADGNNPTSPNKSNNGNGGSDRRFKENIVEVGTHPAGFSLYLFDYQPKFRGLGEGRQFGVMADEVEPLFPNVVSRSHAGYAFVDYDQLGITRH